MNECYFYMEPRNHTLYPLLLRPILCSTACGTMWNRTEPDRIAQDELALPYSFVLCVYFSRITTSRSRTKVRGGVTGTTTAR